MRIFLKWEQMGKFSGSGRQRKTSPWPGGGVMGGSPQGAMSPLPAAGISKSSNNMLVVTVTYLL